MIKIFIKIACDNYKLKGVINESCNFSGRLWHKDK